MDATLQMETPQGNIFKTGISDNYGHLSETDTSNGHTCTFLFFLFYYIGFQ